MEEFVLGSKSTRIEKEIESDTDNEEETDKEPPRKRKAEEISETDEKAGSDTADDKAPPGVVEQPTEPIVPTEPVDPYKKRKLQLVIMGYKRHKKFGPRLTESGIDFEVNPNMSEEQLAQLISDIRFTLDCTSPGSFTKWVIDNGTKGYEKLLCAMEIDVSGLSAILDKDPQWADLVDEICLEHAEMTAVSATTRGLLYIANATRLVQDSNHRLKTALPANKLPAHQQAVQMYQNL